MPLTLILGQKEALDGDIIIRDMSTGIQEVVRMDKAVEELKNEEPAYFDRTGSTGIRTE